MHLNLCITFWIFYAYVMFPILMLKVAQTTSQSEEINLPPLSDSFMTMLQGTPNKEQLEQRENEDSDVHNK